MIGNKRYTQVDMLVKPTARGHRHLPALEGARKQPVPGFVSKLCAVPGSYDHQRCYSLRCSCDCHKGGLR